MRATILSTCILIAIQAKTQGPDLIGYWHNWNDGAAPYLELSEVDPRYTIIEISFAVPAAGTTYNMVFEPAETSPSLFLADIAALHAQGRKVLISMGGANATVQLNSDGERDQFVISMLSIMAAYDFDGLDIDLEGSSVTFAGGTISTPIGASLNRLIDAVNDIADAFEAANGVAMMLTMAPETAYVQGGQSAFGGIWGAYLPIIDALRERLDILQVQLYNSGSMYGIDGAIYTQGTADFIVSQTEALLQGFNTSGGSFAPLPPEKVAIGLPACPSAAGGGYTDPAVVAAAVNYLRGTGPQPGSYTRIGTYPSLRGLMTWSINWDEVSSCNNSSAQFAQSFEDIFGLTTVVPSNTAHATNAIWPTVLRAGDVMYTASSNPQELFMVMDALGRSVAQLRSQGGTMTLPTTLEPGRYWLRSAASDRTRVQGSFVIE